MKLPPMTRFMRKIDRENEAGHWLWTGVRAGAPPHEYGYFRPGSRSTDPKVPAHRWIYEQTIGPIPDGLELDHVCRVKLCVNPAHMEPVTEAENHKRKRLEICRSGLHDLTIERNVQWDKQGRRRGCAECTRARDRARIRKR